MLNRCAVRAEISDRRMRGFVVKFGPSITGPTFRIQESGHVARGGGHY